MEVTDILSLLGGLALFLYGMQMMSNGLEAAAGNKMKKILEKLTANRFLGIAVGAGITAVIQSSSATTVMVVGFVNSGMMRLEQAVWIIMGANIGTTITGQLIALDVGAIAPLFAFLGVAMVVFVKNIKAHHYGMIIAGLGILFIGMEMMSSSMMPLRDSAAFVDLMTKFSNPLLGILAGTAFTALIQSSSASVGILQALAVSGAITLPSAVFVLFGQNIGTCITAVLAAIGTSRNAKRTTIIHLMFNIIGTIIFTIVCISFPLANYIQSITPGNPAAQIANMHTLFNITTTLLLLPFGNHLAKLAKKILPEKKGENDEEMHLEYIRYMENAGERVVGNSSIAINGIRKELERMTGMVRENVDMSFRALKEEKPSYLKEVNQREEYIDYLNKEISKYISSIMAKENNEADSRLISAFFKTSSNLERIGDHATNLCEYSKFLKEKDISLSRVALNELDAMHEMSMQAMKLLECIGHATLEGYENIVEIEQEFDDMTDQCRTRQMDRLKTGKCSDEGCVIYSEILTDFERIGDHILNIGEDMAEATGKLEVA